MKASEVIYVEIGTGPIPEAEYPIPQHAVNQLCLREGTDLRLQFLHGREARKALTGIQSYMI
jgi:hypothetical protein